ncbi:MAG: sensor domain-containing diguanylate cyclase [Leptospirales bacterium]
MSINELHRLYANIGKVITSGVTFQKVVDGIMLEVEHHFTPEHWSLLRLDTNSNDLFFVAIRGMDFKKVKNIRLKLGEGVAGQVAQDRISRFVPDTSEEPDFSSKVDEATGFITKSIIAVPVYLHDQTYGIIEVVNKLDGTNFTTEEHLTLQTIADFAAIAFSNLQMFEKLKNMAYTDALTGAYNRAKLGKLIDKRKNIGENDRRRHKHKYSIAFVLDINFFKNLNDQYGHRHGDEILIDYVHKMQNIIRDEDSLYRTGGDEFLLLTDADNQEDAKIIQQGMTQRLNKFNNECKAQKASCTFAFGSAIEPYFEVEKAIQNADMEMYNNKRSQSPEKPEERK